MTIIPLLSSRASISSVLCIFISPPKRPARCLAHSLCLMTTGLVNEYKHEKAAPGMTSPGFNHSPVRPLGHVINGRMRWSKPAVLFYFPVAYLKPASCSEKHVRLNTRTACFMRKKKITKRPRKEIEKRLKHTSWGSSLF